jgi:uncharacterized protein (TIGR02466 family)
MKDNLFFPTVIGSDSNLELAETMLPVARKYLDDQQHVTNAWGYKNTYTGGRGIEEFSDLKPFVDYINTKAIEYLERSGYNSDQVNFRINIFASEMFEGDSHPIHSHANSILSGIFYLQVPEGSSSIIFYDPRTHYDSISLPKREHHYFNWQEAYLNPESGLFLIWQSWLRHSVPTNKSKEGRITLVFNIAWA